MSDSDIRGFAVQTPNGEVVRPCGPNWEFLDTGTNEGGSGADQVGCRGSKDTSRGSKSPACGPITTDGVLAQFGLAAVTTDDLTGKMGVVNRRRETDPEVDEQLRVLQRDRPGDLEVDEQLRVLLRPTAAEAENTHPIEGTIPTAFLPRASAVEKPPNSGRDGLPPAVLLREREPDEEGEHRP